MAGTRYTEKSPHGLRRLRPKSGECGPPNSRVNRAQVLFATESYAVDADDLRANVPERAAEGAGYTCVVIAHAAPESRLKENRRLVTLIVMMAISWGWST